MLQHHGDYHIVTFDNRGVGMSDKPANRYSIAMMATDTLELMSYLNWEVAHVVGVR